VDKEYLYTAVISDLHLSEAEPDHPKFPLWKKFKRKEFFYDDVLVEFFQHIQDRSGGRPVELILNGDVFDFDFVLTQPQNPSFRISWLEKKRGLFPQEAKAVFKMRKILTDHEVFVKGLRNFLLAGNQVVFIIGNHDLELHFPEVQKEIELALRLPEELKDNLRFCAWFYRSNEDTLIEHGNQYDRYCVCQTPISPLIKRFNRIELRLPFGNLAGRFLVNGMGYINPNVDSSFIMTLPEYLRFFVKYMMRTQPLLLWTWLWGSAVTLYHSFWGILLPSIKDPLTLEDRIDQIANKSKASARMVRELKELAVHPASYNPFLIARELWLDRAILGLGAFAILFWVFASINVFISISIWWMVLLFMLVVPFIIFYSKSIRSEVATFKEPNERVLKLASTITKVNRVVCGHTHEARHEWVGDVEYLNTGVWLPAFEDVECTRALIKRTFVWIAPEDENLRTRKSELIEFRGAKTPQIASHLSSDLP
jgi:UDP-2,3-diacylglucosamine pyrophosphatase LpxH